MSIATALRLLATLLLVISFGMLLGSYFVFSASLSQALKDISVPLLMASACSMILLRPPRSH